MTSTRLLMAAILGIDVYRSKCVMSCLTASRRFATSRYWNSVVINCMNHRDRICKYIYIYERDRGHIFHDARMICLLRGKWDCTSNWPTAVMSIWSRFKEVIVLCKWFFAQSNFLISAHISWTMRSDCDALDLISPIFSNNSRMAIWASVISYSNAQKTRKLIKY